MQALILFYFKIEPNNFNELARYWGYIEALEKTQILPIAQIPLKLK